MPCFVVRQTASIFHDDPQEISLFLCVVASSCSLSPHFTHPRPSLGRYQWPPTIPLVWAVSSGSLCICCASNPLFSILVMYDTGDEFDRACGAAKHGISTNEQSGIYRRGATYDITRKYEVFHCYLKHKHCDRAKHPNISEIIRESKVSHACVRMIEREYLEKSGISDSKHRVHNLARGPGNKTLDKLNMVVLMFLYLDEPSRCNGGTRSTCSPIRARL